MRGSRRAANREDGEKVKKKKRRRKGKKKKKREKEEETEMSTGLVCGVLGRRLVTMLGLVARVEVSGSGRCQRTDNGRGSSWQSRQDDRRRETERGGVEQ